MNCWLEFTVNVTLKINRGSLGIKYDRQGEFRFCAQSADDARAIVGYHAPGAMTSIDVTRMVQVVEATPLPPQRSDECLSGDCDLCNFAWCLCPHHSVVQFKAEHPGLKNLSEIESEQIEEAFA